MIQSSQSNSHLQCFRKGSPVASRGTSRTPSEAWICEAPVKLNVQYLCLRFAPQVVIRSHGGVECREDVSVTMSAAVEPATAF